MIGTLMVVCIFGMVLVVSFSLGMLIYMVVVAVKEEIEINKLSK